MSDPSSFRTARRFMCPPWLREGDGEKVGYSLDVMKDASVEAWRLSMMARLPQNDPSGATTAPPDALAAMGRDRRVVPGLDESPQSYAARLIQWIDEAKRRGNPFALMKKLAEYLGPLPSFRVVDAQGNWFSRDADGNESYVLAQANWEWDDHPFTDGGRKRWSRYWPIIYPNGLWTDGAEWGDPAVEWGLEDLTWGTSATPEQVATVKAIVNDWKPARSRVVNIVIAFDAASFDPAAAVADPGMPNGLWEHWSRNVGGVQVPARLDTARYWDSK